MTQTKRRKPQTSVKQILVRDFNWRMGNLRRIYHSLWGLSEDNRDQIQGIIEREGELQKRMHEARLKAISPENIDSAESYLLMAEDLILADAIWEAGGNKLKE